MAYEDSFDAPEEQTPPIRVDLDELLGRKHRDNVFAAYFCGQLGSYLHPLGYTTSILVSKVETGIEQELPTLRHQTMEMFRLLENQLLPGVLGKELPSLVEAKDGQLCERLDEFQAQTDRVHLLVTLRNERLELLDVVNCDEPIDGLDM